MAAWETGPQTPELSDGAVHLWIAGLDWPDGPHRTFWDVLSAEERERAQRFRFENLQRRFIAAHGILRDILSRYLGVTPGAIRILIQDYGKPFVTMEGTATRLQFNLSHADELAVYAVTRTRSIGVDIESIHPIPELQSIAADHFTAQERALIEAAPPEDRDRAFLTCWTRKEAYIKAIGRGLSIPLPSFDAFIPSGAPGRLLSSDDDATPVRQWWISDLPPIRDHVGAVVIDGRANQYSYWHWSARQIHPRAE